MIAEAERQTQAQAPAYVIEARSLLQYQPEQCWDVIPDRKIRLIFDDGYIDTTGAATILSQYLWWAQREHPSSPLLIKHHLGNNLLTSGHISSTIGSASWAAYNANPGKIDREELGLRIRRELNRMANDANDRLGRWVTTMSALDLLEVLDHPKIKAANEKIQSIDYDNPMNLINAAKHVDETHAAQRAVLTDPSELRTNKLTRAIRSRMVDISQILQCIGPRGLVTDYDHMVFKRPVVYGFGEGLPDLYSLAVESRSATKSLMLTKDPLADTEYFNREMQLICATVKNLHEDTDCGSTDYLPWLVARNNLNVLDGLYHADNGQLKIIRSNSTELIGKVVMLRTALTCNHPDEHGICSTCFGDIAKSVPRQTNIGHMASIVLCALVSQRVLSTKHNDMISGFGEGGFGLFNSRFLRVMDNVFELGVSPELAGLKVSLVVAKEDMANLADINLADNIDSLSTIKISQMTEVAFDVEYEPGVAESNIVPVSTGSRKASFTPTFLTYMKRYGWEMTENLDVRIDLSNWNKDLPIWELPRKHSDMMEFMGSVETLVKASGSSKEKGRMDLSDHNNTAIALSEFHDLVSQKFAINITHLAVILRATLVRSVEEKDYRLPVAGGPRQFASYKQIMAMRSLSAMCAYQEQSGMFRNVQSFINKKRARHPFDVIVIPNDQ